jgi:hypothetical protein
LQAQVKALSDKNASLQKAFKEKAKAHQDVSKKYNDLKHRVQMDPQLAEAAAEEAEEAINAMAVHSLADELQHQYTCQTGVQGFGNAGYGLSNQNPLVHGQTQNYHPGRQSWHIRGPPDRGENSRMILHMFVCHHPNSI